MTCPVLAFTPDVTDVLQWFQWTHALQVGFGAAVWVRTSLPRRGGVGDQDARLLAALDHIRGALNEITTPANDRAAHDELDAFRRRHGRNRR